MIDILKQVFGTISNGNMAPLSCVFLTCDPLAADLVPGCVEEKEAVEAGEEAGRQRRQRVVVQVKVLQAPRGPAVDEIGVISIGILQCC